MFALSRHCRIPGPSPYHGTPFLRPISISTPLLGRIKTRARPAPSKRVLQAKARKRELKNELKNRSPYEDEKMTLAEAIQVLRAVEVSRPNATYELVLRIVLGRGTAVPRGRISLPHATKSSKTDRILVFAEGRAADEAKSAGADIVGGADLADGVASGKHHATLYLATPELARAIASKLGRVLGPRGLMPTERRGTVTRDPAGYIKQLKGSDEWRSDKQGTIRSPIGKMSFPVQNVMQNVLHFIDTVKKETGSVGDKADKSGGKKAVAIRRVLLSSQQGPSIAIADVA